MNNPLFTPVDPFSVDLSPALYGRAAAYVARPLLDHVLGLAELRRTYRKVAGKGADTFCERSLNELNVTIDCPDRDLIHLPQSGPVIVAANHPRGALDGLALMTLVRRVRPDVRLLANYLLARIPELRDSCFFVDPFGGPAAAARSLAGLRAAHLWLRNGGALIMFPSGEVAHQRDAHGHLVDGPWSETLGRLAEQTRATVVPATIDGANSPLFYAFGRLHPLLRTALLGRELLAARSSRVQVTFGKQTDPARAIEVEIGQLPSESVLVTAGRFRVVCASALEIPHTLLEIGRLRAVTYRAAGEGSGSDSDVDEFDRAYLHLFVWDAEARCVVGAYRLGRADLLTKTKGVAALYTRTLFDYGPEMIEAMSPALELGRSFVRAEYQRDFQALLLLWRGIGTFVVRHPHYRTLFGPVSISSRYHDASLTLLTAFLEQNHLDPSLARLVTPKHPRARQLGTVPVPADVTAVNRLISTLESDGKGMPVLLRQYLKLNARTLGFSVDPQFGDVVDALMAIDLTTVSPAILRRYLGDEGLHVYRRHHATVLNRTAA